MNYVVSVPSATAQAIAGIAFTALAMVLPVAARWTALALVLGVFGIAGIVAAFAGARCSDAARHCRGQRHPAARAASAGHDGNQGRHRPAHRSLILPTNSTTGNPNMTNRHNNTHVMPHGDASTPPSTPATPRSPAEMVMAAAKEFGRHLGLRDRIGMKRDVSSGMAKAWAAVHAEKISSSASTEIARSRQDHNLVQRGDFIAYAREAQMGHEVANATFVNHSLRLVHLHHDAEEYARALFTAGCRCLAEEVSAGVTTERDAAAAVAKWHAEFQEIVSTWDAQRQRSREAADDLIEILMAKALPPTA